MDAKQRQAQLDSITPEELAKVKQHQASTEGAYKVDSEWLLLTEFAMNFGWQAYLDARDDNISSGEMLTLIEASRKINARTTFNQAYASLIGSGSAQSKKPTQAFNSMTKNLTKQMKVDE